MTKINKIDLQEKQKLAMSVAENIETALSSLWQLAMAMASLKHIAGMDGQEEDLASADTGQEDDNSLPDTHRRSHVDKTEPSGDDTFANKENAESEEIELAALISSLTLTMVCQQNKAPAMKMSDSEELIENVDETDPESVPISSMIGHQLPKLDSILDISMVSHHQRVTDSNVDSGSLVFRQTQTHHNVQQLERESIEMSKFETNLTKQKEDSAFSTTLLAHQVPPVDTYLESTSIPNGDDETLLQANGNISMVVHQIVDEETSATEIKKTNETVKDLGDSIRAEDEENCIIRESEFISSLCSHQLSPIKTQLENTDYPVSLSVHTVDNYSEDTHMSLKPENGMISSMVSHQSCQEEKSGANLKSEEFLVKNPLNISHKECNDQQIYQHSKYYSSVAHQLSSSAADDEFLTSSTVAHGVMRGTSEEDIIEPKSGLLTSMVTHQFPAFTDDVDDIVYSKHYLKACNHLTESIEEGNVVTNLPISMESYQLPGSEVPTLLTECLASNMAHTFISDVDDNTKSLVSMASNMTDSRRKENEEAAPINEENMKNYHQGKRPEGEDEDIAQNIQSDILIYDNHTRRPKIKEIPSPDEIKIEEFKIKRKNTERISKHNVETTETHIVNNVKGVECKAEDVLSYDKSITSGSERIQSMLTTTEKMNPLDTLEDLILEGASENLIAASCTLEDNSPVIITTSNQKRDQTDKISSRETDKFKNNQQAELYENEMGQHLKTKNKEEENNNFKLNDKETGILRSLPTETKANVKSKKKERSQKSSTQIASFNANSGKQTYKIRFKVKPNEDPAKSSVLKYLLGYFGGQQ